MTAWPADALIRAKREGQSLDAAQWRDLAIGIAQGEWNDGQVGAFAMAVAWRGLEIAECRDFTLALRDSGRRLVWDDLPGPVLDKHSTGGVGDCVSLALAPLVASCGGYVPMISGRGLGHTGGTLDKLESLRGYDVNPTFERLRRVMSETGCAIVGQSPDLVPADLRLYAIRDVTATVDVPDLMVASILSKKLAGGAQALVLDVKTGSGAQTRSETAALALAQRMQAVVADCDIALTVALSDMGEVLGGVAGNALEVRAALDLLTGRPSCPRLRELTLALSAELLCLGDIDSDRPAATLRLRRALDSGAAAERFARMVAGLGGPTGLLECPDRHLPRAPVVRPVSAASAGFIQSVDVRVLGKCVVDLGGGRRTPNTVLDRAVGLSGVRGRGERVDRGETLAVVHARDASQADVIAAHVRSAFCFGDHAPLQVPLLRWLPAPAPLPAAQACCNIPDETPA
ncbi:MAG: thymidine phosphorylase [Xanthomonadaceae bacterium]|nr:thymidine phosphorylase [Xanthomonadaceae bacterium]MDE2084196.1 thymidine phosphorylase [Xanthomonadaceae bacterium]